MKPQAIERFGPTRRYQILVATVVDELVRLTDEALDLFDVAMATLDQKARFELEEVTKTNASAANDTVRLFGQVARIVLDRNVADSQVRATILNQTGQQRFVEAVERTAQIERPTDGNYLEFLCDRYRYARRFAPHVLAAFAFHAATPADPLLGAVDLLKALNTSRTRRVPDNVPLDFAPAKWKQYITTADGRIDRRRWEMCVLTELKGALRGANLWVDHSRRYQDPTNYLLPLEQWERLRPESPAATGIPLDPDTRIDQLHRLLVRHLQTLNSALPDTTGVKIDNDRLIVAPSHR